MIDHYAPWGRRHPLAAGDPAWRWGRAVQLLNHFGYTCAGATEKAATFERGNRKVLLCDNKQSLPSIVRVA